MSERALATDATRVIVRTEDQKLSSYFKLSFSRRHGNPTPFAHIQAKRDAVATSDLARHGAGHLTLSGG